MLFVIRRHVVVLRPLWVVMLLMMLVVKPTIVAASEVHESMHLLSHGHLHDADVEGQGIPSDEMASDTGYGDWHALMHLGHCCVQSAALLPSVLVLAGSPHTMQPTAMKPSFLTSVARARMLRPPIIG